MLIRDAHEGLVGVADGLWTVVHHRRALGLHSQMRMAVVELVSGGLLLYSPTPIDDPLARSLSELGPVEHIVAPSRGHHMFAGHAKLRYPSATLWADSSLSEKRPDLDIDQFLGSVTPHPFDADVDVLHLGGTPSISEWVLFHRASHSLLCCDFLFNVRDEESLLSVGLFRALGVWRRAGQSRPWKHWTKDRSQAAACVDQVLRWDLRRIVMAHGEVIEVDARSVLEEATSWLRAPVPAPARDDGSANQPSAQSSGSRNN